ncbi:NAD(P)H-binding protein [Rubrobacter tropicus]|uniref:NAD(P)H-binding protein n=1 Tax=Rubrobacter tropicus TaxID=2653851 RepID=A0A6G8QF31_9ACTN|nr:SDR family oxidoreductase [Rubrobacter tropicus]QIN84847.1 NAD(P)H-binding protein [Rubrobacter tropicus]
MKVLVAGAHGNTARRLVRALVKNGHEVRGLVRKEGQLPDVEADGAEAVLVDLEAEEVDGAVGEAVAGCDAVVFAAGAGAGSGAARKETMDYGGAAKLVEAAEKKGVGRYLMLSSMGADDPEGRDEAMRPYLRAKGRADEKLRESGLEWTIIRPGRLTDGEGAGRIDAAESLGRYGEIPREDVAAAFAVALESPNTVGKTFEILSGETPVREALEGL